MILQGMCYQLKRRGLDETSIKAVGYGQMAPDFKFKKLSLILKQAFEVLVFRLKTIGVSEKHTNFSLPNIAMQLEL